MTTEIKPCPFCGSMNVMAFVDADDYRFVGCENCGARGAKDNENSEAIEAWNDRVTVWMAVVSQMPPPSQSVLAVVDYGLYRNIVRAQFIEAGSILAAYGESGTLPRGWYQDAEGVNIGFFWITGTVTHWMPLPELPEVQP